MTRRGETDRSEAGCSPASLPRSPRRWACRTLVSSIAVIALAVAPPVRGSRAAERVATAEYEVKAAFLYKFAGYVEWPRESFDGPSFTIAVVGAERLARELREAVRERTVHDRPIEVRRLRSGEPLSGVHMLFVGADEHARLGDLVRPAQSRSVLTVTEFEGALEAGSVINFVVSERRVRFEVSLDSAERSRLRLSSRLLAVAERVVPEGG